MASLYEKRSKKIWLTSKLKSFFIQDSLTRISRKNELRDYFSILKKSDQKLWHLHKSLEGIRKKSQLKYQSYDYGNGYYYQSLQSINITGYRDTENRLKLLQLPSKLRGKRVLDIGSNSGFLIISLADRLKKGVGVEFNPYLVETAKTVQKYFEIDNLEFLPMSFENYQSEEKFDAVLSLANHSTYDQNTHQTLDDYFKKISSLLSEDGELIFESHPPQIEPAEKLAETLKVISKYFSIEDRPTVKLKGFMDRDRAYVFAKKWQKHNQK